MKNKNKNSRSVYHSCRDCRLTGDTLENTLEEIAGTLQDMQKYQERKREAQQRGSLRTGFLTGVGLGVCVLPVGHALLRMLLRVLIKICNATAAAMGVPVSDLIGIVAGVAIALTFLWLMIRCYGLVCNWIKIDEEKE